MDNKDEVYNVVVKYMKDNGIANVQDVDSDEAFGSAYDFIVNLFELVESEIKTKKIYNFSVAMVTDYRGNDITEVWIANEDGSDFDEEEDVNVYHLMINKLKMDHMSESCYHTYFYPNYVKEILLQSGRFKYDEEMQKRMG